MHRGEGAGGMQFLSNKLVKQTRIEDFRDMGDARSAALPCYCEIYRGSMMLYINLIYSCVYKRICVLRYNNEGIKLRGQESARVKYRVTRGATASPFGFRYKKCSSAASAPAGGDTCKRSRDRGFLRDFPFTLVTAR